MDGVWIVYGWCMDNVWIVYGWCMDSVWIEYQNTNLRSIPTLNRGCYDLVGLSRGGASAKQRAGVGGETKFFIIPIIQTIG